MIPTMKQKKTEVLLEAIGGCLSSKATPAGTVVDSIEVLGNHRATTSLPELEDGKDEGGDER